MEITLDDLLVLEPRLAWRVERSAEPEMPAEERRVVSWIVSARTTPPHLPLLRGGEVLLVPSRVTAAVGGDLPALLREATLRDVVAVVFERDERGLGSLDAAAEDVLVLIWDGDLTGETETAINRLLTECRGNLYRVGSELERQMSDLAASRAGLSELVRSASELSGLTIHVTDVQGRILASSHLEFDASDSAVPPPYQSGVERKLPSGLTLRLGPLRPEQRVVARFLVDRIAAAAIVAARQDEAARPRGPHRVEAMDALVTGRSGSASERRAAALALGLDPDAIYLVAVSSGEDDAPLAKALSTLGTVHVAGVVTGQRTSLVAASGRPEPETLLHRAASAKRQWGEETKETTSTLAISAPVSGVVHVPAAARQARLIARLQEQGRFPRRAVSFDSIDDVGAFQLLYPLRDSSELHQFVSAALGILESRDHRGTLRETLRAYLETGGSHADTSNRLGIHRNTLAYRLRRIAELIGRDVGDPTTWLTLHLALWASDLLDLEVDPDDR